MHDIQASVAYLLHSVEPLCKHSVSVRGKASNPKTPNPKTPNPKTPNPKTPNPYP